MLGFKFPLGSPLGSGPKMNKQTTKKTTFPDLLENGERSPSATKARNLEHKGTGPVHPSGGPGFAGPRGRSLSKSWAGRTLAGSWKGQTRFPISDFRRGSARCQGAWDLQGEAESLGTGLRGKKVGSYSLVMASILSAPPQEVSLGGLPPPAGPGPRGAVAAGTASRYQLPLRPRAPPLGGNGQRACARTAFISCRGGRGVERLLQTRSP